MKKICSVVGARPQFIKLAVVSRELRKYFNEVLIHTGQHYDYNMSDVFFEEMNIPHPDYNLGICGGTHGQMTGRMLIELEKVLINEKPDMVLLFGDTNSTLAAALAASKLQIPVCHIEAGARGGILSCPEEINRVVTDHISTINLACTENGFVNLKKEGLEDTATVVGDPMFDAFSYYSQNLDGSEMSNIKDYDENIIKVPEKYYYMTCHRQENTATDNNLNEILKCMNELDAPTIYPVHPRNHERALRLVKENNYKNITLTLPVGYLTSISLILHSQKVVTDSGGIQREAFFAQKQCVAILDDKDWPEIYVNNCVQLCKPCAKEIREKLSVHAEFCPTYFPFGTGNSSKKIVKILENFFTDRDI